MPTKTFDEFYRKTEEYKSLYGMIKAINPTLPHQLCEMAMIMHFASPNMFKHNRGRKLEVQDEDLEILGGSIVVEDSMPTEVVL